MCCVGGDSGNQIGDVGAGHIARALEKNTTITKLDLSCECRRCVRMARMNDTVNQIGTSGAERIAQALEKNTVVREVYLNCAMHCCLW